MSTSTRVTASCNCKPPKCSGRCRCTKNNVKRSVHCHSSEFDCGNISSLLHRTVIALVPLATMESGRGDHASASRTGRKRAATSTVTKVQCAPKPTQNRQSQADSNSESLESVKSWMQKELHTSTGALKILTLLEKAKANTLR